MLPILTVLNMSHHNLSEERDELQKMYSTLQASYKNLREEKDKLSQQYSHLQTTNVNNYKENKELVAELQTLNTILDNDWLYFKGSFYHYCDKERSWEDSRSFCQEQGADLISINNEEEQNFLRVYGGRRWIGLSDRETEGVWEWVDGSSLTLSSWMPGEPNDANDAEDCGEILIFVNESKLNDIPCNKRQSCLCEMKRP
ncbi:C-type lectin domain family 4 member M-like [Boleophthalmus pectinirostris]|uniref:C-type lectin domain family 4 member M-like n=1 Tax=Boleophthalmus pectinirostris TaxID=150288 RepID=UPI00242E528C|nr:C-type lectin domain family 4 member M-like [Boleophthalmus pectinirostris]